MGGKDDAVSVLIQPLRVGTNGGSPRILPILLQTLSRRFF